MTVTLDDIHAALAEIIKLIKKEFEADQIDWQIEILTIGNTSAPLYTIQKIVRLAIIQNLSTSDAITLMRGPKGKVAPVTAGAGIVLNPAPAAGQAGGSLKFHNIDLSNVTAITQTNNSQSLGVMYVF